jgi:hypothetical protein
MKKIDRAKAIVIVSMTIGILGYFYIMVLMRPGIFEVLALIFFSFVISVSAAILLNEDFKGINISDSIRKRFDEIAKAIVILTPFIVTLLAFYRMNR